MLVCAATGATIQSVKPEQYPLRSGCEEEDETVAVLHAGDKVEVRFGLAGASVPCYAVTATVDGGKVNGYLPGSVLDHVDDLERERRAARSVEIPKIVTRAAEGLRAQPLRVGPQPMLDAIRLLEASQPRQALEVLETALRLHPKDPALLALAGMAAHRSDQLALARSYWQESLALRHDPEIERLYRKLEKETAADRSGQQLFATRFTLRYDDAVVDSETARLVVGVLEEEYSRISYQLGCRPDERMTAILQSREAYMRATDAAEWSGGMFDGRIRVPVPQTRVVSPELRRTLAHETVHACLASIGSWPAWLHEGLAQKLSGAVLAPSVKQKFQAMARAGALPRLNRLGQSWSRMSANHASAAYGLALAAVETYFDRYREFGIQNLLRNSEMLPRVADELDEYLRQ